MAAGQEEEGEEGAPNRAAKELDEGAATTLAGRRGRQILLPPPRAELEAAGFGQPRRADVHHRRRYGRALQEGAGEGGGVPGAAVPPLRSSAALPSPKTMARRRRWRWSRCRRGELVLLRVDVVLIAGVCVVSCSSIPAARRARSSFELGFGSLQASASQSPFGSFPRPASSPRRGMLLGC